MMHALSLTIEPRWLTTAISDIDHLSPATWITAAILMALVQVSRAWTLPTWERVWLRGDAGDDPAVRHDAAARAHGLSLAGLLLGAVLAIVWWWDRDAVILHLAEELYYSAEATTAPGWVVLGIVGVGIGLGLSATIMAALDHGVAVAILVLAPFYMALLGAALLAGLLAGPLVILMAVTTFRGMLGTVRTGLLTPRPYRHR